MTMKTGNASRSRTPSAADFWFAAPAPDMSEPPADGAKTRRFTGVAYTGAPLNHPFWDLVIFDLSTTTAAEKTPVLINHDPDKRAGFAPLVITDTEIRIDDGTLMTDTEDGFAVARESDHGFPWQMSVFIEPGSIERIEPGNTVTVNGHEISGPATVFRNGLIREVSFTPTGVDDQTTAAAASALAGIPISSQHTEEVDSMTQEEMQAEIEGLRASLDQETAARKAAEEALEELRGKQREEAVKALFSAVGREFSEEAAKPYLSMDEATFSAVANDMKKTVADLPDGLFSSQADQGQNHEEGQGGANTQATIDYNQIYAARRVS